MAPFQLFSHTFSFRLLRCSLCATALLLAASLAQADPASVAAAPTGPTAQAGADAARVAQAGSEIERIARAEPSGAGFVAAPLRLQAEPSPPAAQQSSLPTWFLLFGGLIGAGFVTALRQR